MREIYHEKKIEEKLIRNIDISVKNLQNILDMSNES